MLTWTDDTSDPQYERSAAALEVLRTTPDARGRLLDVVPIHQPGPIVITAQEARGRRLDRRAPCLARRGTGSPART